MAGEPYFRASKSRDYRTHLASGVALAFAGSLVRIQFFTDELGVPDKPGMVTQIVDRVAQVEVVMPPATLEDMVISLNALLEQIKQSEGDSDKAGPEIA